MAHDEMEIGLSMILLKIGQDRVEGVFNELPVPLNVSQADRGPVVTSLTPRLTIESGQSLFVWP